MKVVIAGAGSVGRSVAKELTHAGHDITIVDKQPSAMKIASVPEADWIRFRHALRNLSREVQ